MAIKKLDPKARFRVVAQMDDAIDNNDYENDLSKDRYAKYLDTLDMGVLKFVGDQKPSVFVVRPLTNLELADLNGRYLVIDAERKTASYRDQVKMFLEMFDLCCEGMENEEGKIEKVSSGEIPYGVASEIGSIISLIATLGKHAKKA
jgi:hypothetical protein